MKNEDQVALLRHKMDEILKAWRRTTPVVPEGGWVRTVREALDMTEKEFAARLNISEQTAYKLERSEIKQGIRLATLRKAAKALDCTLVYAIVPKRTLEATLDKRRRGIAIVNLVPIVPSLSAKKHHDLITAYAKRVDRRRVWRDDSFEMRRLK